MTIRMKQGASILRSDGHDEYINRRHGHSFPPQFIGQMGRHLPGLGSDFKLDECFKILFQLSILLVCSCSGEEL